MKKIFLPAIAIMAFMGMNAQETKFGVKAGANLSTLTGDVDNNSSIAGFHVGGFAEIKISDKFAVQPELLFSTQGTTIKDDYPELTAEDRLNLSYINLPVMAKFYVIPNLSLEAGPQLGVLVGAKEKYEDNMGGITTSSEEDVKDNFKSIDFGFNLGVSYDFTENFFAGARYNLSLANIADAGDSDYKLNNSVFSLSVGYKF